MEDWKETSISDIIEIIGGGTPKTKNKEYWNGDIPWLSVVDFNTGRKYVFETEKKITEKGLNNSSTKLLKRGDIIISARGTVGVVAMLGKRMTFNQSCYGIRAKKEISTNNYVYYVLKDTIENFIRYAHGGVFNTITRNTFKEINIPLPPLPEQKAIAGVLSSLDDKIDLLHRQNQTLEQLAETLFREWFVRRQEDWEEMPLSSMADYLNGLACQKFPPKNDVDKLPVLKIKQLRNGIGDDCDWASTDIDEEYLVKSGDIVFSWSGSLMVKIWNGENCILNQHLFKVTSKDFPKWFYYQWTLFHLKKFMAIARAHATTMGHIRRRDLDEAMVLIPPDSELNEMTKTMEPFMDKIIENNKQIETLTQLRDTLLPKLMRGEVRVNME